MGDLDRILGVLGEARHRLFRIAYVLGPLFGVMLLVEIVPVTLHFGGLSVPFGYPWPSPFYNVTAQVFRAMVSWMLPPGVELLNVGVGDSILIQMEIGLLLTLILGMPWIVHELGAFLMPALRRNERQLLRQVGIPATVLFAIGTSLGLFLITPFALLYSLAFGIVFELPVFVYTLTRLGLVRASAWRKHWRGAVIGALVFGMVITPDNSGITMLMVATPMIGLYLGGAWFAARWERSTGSRGRGPAPAGAG